MGQATSVAALEPLERLSGPAPIRLDDAELWEELFSLQLPSSTAEELQQASHAFCAEMARNNAQSGNLQTLIRRTIDLLTLAQRPRANPGVLRQACNSVFLLRLFLKHMIETLDADALITHLATPQEDAAAAYTHMVDLSNPLAEALLTTLVHVRLSDDSYYLHMETSAALAVCLSTQMFIPLAEPSPQPLAASILSSSGPGAELLVSRLLSHIVEKPQPPQPSAGLLRKIGRGVKSVLLLPYYSFTYLLYSTADDESPLTLSDRSLLLLLLLTQHLPPSLFPYDGSTTDVNHNPFLEALREIGDRQPFDGAAPSASSTSAADPEGGGGGGGGGGGDGIGYDPETGMLKRSRVSFSSLHDAIAAALPEQSAALLLYLLLHGNRDYLDYSLSRTDPETILVPLLRVLHDSKTLPINR